MALAAAALGATISFVLPGAAARLERAAYASAGSDPAAALAKLDLAADLNPLSGQALAVRGIVARREGMTWTARQALEAALEREPRSWYIQLQLALLEARDRRLEAARERIEAAAALNPRQPLLRRLRHRLLRGARIDPEGLERELYEQRQAKLRPVDGSGR